jgi:hypothetical protein
MTGRASTAGFGRLSNRRKTDMRVLARLPAAPFVLLSSVFAVAFLLAARAFGQEVDTVISAEPWVATFMPFVSTITVALIGALVPLVFAYVLKKWGLDVEQAHRDALQTSLTNAAGLLLQKLGRQAEGATIDVRSQAMADAIRYVEKSAPDALKSWGITPDSIAEKIIAKIPQIEASSGAAPMSTPTTFRSPWIIGVAAVGLMMLAGCGAGTFATVAAASGLGTDDLICIAEQVMATPKGTPPREAAEAISIACEIDVAKIIFGGDEVIVEAEGDTVAVDEAANTVAVVD